MSITIRPDGSVTVDNPQDAVAMMKLMNNGAGKVAHSTPVPAVEQQLPTKTSGTVDDHEATTLLYAGGMKKVRRSTLLVYKLLVNSNKVWDIETTSQRLGLSHKVAGAQLMRLTSRGILSRVGPGQYKAK